MYSLIRHGRSSTHLQKWRHLRVSVKLVENAFAFSNSFSSAIAANVSSRDGQKGKNFTVSYLVDSLGLAKKVAESISRKVSFEDKCNPDSVLSLFRSYGFTNSQISSIITDYPLLLRAAAEKSVGLKFKFLQSRGASSSELTEIVSTVPKILAKKEGKSISRYYDLVKEIIEADKSSKFENSCLSLPQGKQENKIRNVLVLRELGVPQKRLFPLLISACGVVCGKEKFEESLKKVVEMGFDPTSSKFVQALKVVYRTSDKTIEEKINVYKRLGFVVGDVWAMFKKCPEFMNNSEKKICQTFETLKKCGLLEDEVLSMFKKYPQCIGLSEKKIAYSIETIVGLGFTRDEFVEMVKCFPSCLNLSVELVKKKIEFLVKEMNWPLKVVVSNTSILGLSMEKRIVPRCNVIKALKSKGLLGDRGNKLSPITSVLKSTDQDFLKRYVSNHEDKELVAELMAILTGDHVS
ncbi:Transcription termination factor MTERF15 [Cardamine amara subsp. amara]|uniref:Transcription termination factor MTERF15 n=1 Tax=Cardamine amara subsp. amara TaxID=228776 RepID=A0ABD1C9J7_CARAN